MPRLSAAERNQAVGHLQAGESRTDVALAFGVSLSTICRLWTRFQTNGTTDDNPRSGRPRVTTARQDRLIVHNHRRNSFIPATETARQTVGMHGRLISNRTVRRRLRNGGLHCRRPVVRPILTPRHRQQRLQWTQNRQHWTWRQWRTVLFSDESRFCISNGDGRIRIWRRAGERYADHNVMEVDTWGGPSVMIWGAIALNHLVGPVFFRNVGPGRGNGITAQRYINQVLRPVAVPYIQQHNNLVLQHDNARAHSARQTVAFLQQNNIRVVPWPALSPDLNPIEHFWDHIQRELNNLQPRPATAPQLERSIRQIWRNVQQATVNRLIHSMPARCRAVVNANGGHTSY